MIGYTKGNWRAKERDSGDGYTIFRDIEFMAGASTSTYRLATVWYPSSSSGTAGAQERLANARLIAAAPDLLEALKEYVSQDKIAEGYGYGVGGEVMQQALAAIAKAEGINNMPEQSK